jgi:hypothetical protein
VAELPSGVLFRVGAGASRLPPLDQLAIEAGEFGTSPKPNRHMLVTHALADLENFLLDNSSSWQMFMMTHALADLENFLFNR